MSIKLYVLPGSHPCAAVEEAMRRKAISFARVDLLPLVPVAVGPLLYGGSTVPGMRLDGERLVGSRKIMRRLDELAPEPPLLPSDPQERERVLEAERWGDDVFQSVPRRILDAGFLRDAGAMESYAGDAKLPLPRAMLRPALPLTAKLMARRNHAQDEPVRADLAELADQLEKIDAWIAEGLLGGDEPNAADLQIGSTIRLLETIGDVRPLIEGHPAAALTRYFPPMAGGIPAGTLPAEWLPTVAAA
jgi:glutathione S-transferase